MIKTKSSVMRRPELIKNLCNIAGLSKEDDNKTADYLTRQQLLELIVYIRMTKNRLRDIENKLAEYLNGSHETCSITYHRRTGVVEKYFLQVLDNSNEHDACIIGLKYDSRTKRFMIGGFGRHREFIEHIAMQYFDLDVLNKNNGIEERWPQRNKMRFVCKMIRKTFIKGLYNLRKDYPAGMIKTKSLGRLIS